MFLYEDTMGFTSRDDDRIAHLRLQEGSERMQPVVVTNTPDNADVRAGHRQTRRVAKRPRRVHDRDDANMYRLLLLASLIVMISTLCVCKQRGQ